MAEIEAKNKSGLPKGTIAGAIVGSLILPGIGTVLGGALGRGIGQQFISSDVAKLAWQRADVYFALGLLYARTGRKQEANQVWVKALTFKADHEPSRIALSKVKS